MQPYQVLHLLIFILLTTPLIEAQFYDDSTPGCSDRCGDVFINFPFGIGRNCSANEWFNVDCKSSKPYISAFNNVEVLYVGQSSVTVNMPVVGADCKNPLQDSNLVLSSSRHAGKNPFLFSASNNILVVEGCGSAAIVENGIIVAGCLTTCGNESVSDLNRCIGIGCCKTRIPHDLESFTFNLTGLERRDGDGTCRGSAFLMVQHDAEEFSPKSVVEDQTVVTVLLSWNPNSTGCNRVCGKVSIPYPFGIEKSCTKDKWFNVDCNSSRPYLSAFNNAEVLAVDDRTETVTVNVSKIFDCKNPVQNTYNLLLKRNSLSFYGTDNILVVDGCGSAAIMYENGTSIAGCSTTCDNDTVTDFNNCFGIGCCQTTIPYRVDHRQSFTLNVTGLERQGGNGSCSVSAFLVDRKSFIQGRFSREFVPMTLTWRYRPSDYDDSRECIRCKEQGGYCFPDRAGTYCHFGDSSKRSLILGVSISMGVLFLTAITYALCILIKKTAVKRRKQRCFKRNGGLLLKQQEATEIGLVDRTLLFTSNELEKATDHFNENRILGRGGQGTVYKGMLADGRIVAIKKSKVVDEGQLKQFINEVVILSQVNHRNVVKLLGCCLETEVPLLVSEFISNGTLYDLIQDEACEFPFSLSLRLQIATEVAGAVSYLHSATSIPIYHRDIKTTNILLDAKYRAKVSDFGTSRFVPIDQTHLTTLVKGTFGYLDPEYFQSSQFTEKSDVYSFGVVLLELLTREKPISLTRFVENRSLATHFLLAMEEGRVMSIFDIMVIKEGSRTELLAIANLAMRCLNFNGRNRPTMKEVATELEGIRLTHVPSTIETNFGHVNHCEEVQLTYDKSTSTSTSMTSDYRPWYMNVGKS